MRNDCRLHIPERVQRVVDETINERITAGLTETEIFHEPHVTSVATEAISRTGVDLTNPKLRRAAERFVCIALANSQHDRKVN